MAGSSWVAWVIVALAGGYLLGSIPTGYLMGRLSKGIDIRQYGSGSTGATNVLRTLGKGSALTVLLIDILKGALTIVLTRWLYTLPMVTVPDSLMTTTWVPWVVTVAALVALVGHSRSIWLGFSGGKSVASGLGILLAMHLPAALGAILIFSIVVAVSRIVSLSSIMTAIAVPLMMLAMNQPFPFQLFGFAAASYIVWRHRTNIQRILAGTEPRIGQKLEQQSTESGG
ncbi:MAG TPA: glycerol-3-phosphate 1-O-acyltransferase PlsY [Elainellaceae cyanobacterium]